MTARGAFGLVLAAAACTDAVPPERVNAYGFTIDCSLPDVCSSDADSSLRLTFHWPPEALPIRVWVEEAADLPQFVRRGIAQWESAALYGELRAVIVGDSTRADVIVRLGPHEDFGLGGGDGAGSLDCRGQTPVVIGLDTGMVLPFRTVIHPRLGATTLEANACMQHVAVHELGHAFGLLLHSPDARDVMHARPGTEVLTESDVATFVALYHTPATVRLPDGR